MEEAKCPKCGRKMTSTPVTKAYCVKCDILIHTPSEVAYSGDHCFDEFIGSPAKVLRGKREPCEATLGPDRIILTWTQEGTPRREDIPFSSIRELGTGLWTLVVRADTGNSR
jgi:hypothetical protein